MQDLDDIDLGILRELQADARISHQVLSERVGLSPSPCSRRIRILESKGVITGYSVHIDERKLGFALNVFVSVKLAHQIDSRLMSFERAIEHCPEVVDCWLMTGNRDYLLRVSVRDLDEFERFLTARLTRIEGVSSIESSIPIRRVKGGTSRLT
ncbi:Lrp/AsnC family transcriptional regulator [Mameliella sediminis]|uniref:Lrp/AsnC family transcriptional regulator n=1 Tax=Mameliella sediminis TaxID=2836866 RepID=UPI001C488FAB|nr:Lrp/AsnC family transcriptional regulator [Mameliella sediminis]MBY6117170.1 Lrp/AsnC family transcriptional regulator [Antarctobacter heliothermus]MBY6147026.1 Lrp/AsnC family transcriptional regulator [Mameliella alba]MBV7396580.1 Lrp/AsnC family transcriptional regulator [Mameliella sediminis]MBY6162869.1 Lrp/AsnC family transcriptional regulator [Mameliella alba]MBY6171133.1 Lrp/AsnC family transcriptional regulator [Mameliella alba]